MKISIPALGVLIVCKSDIGTNKNIITNASAIPELNPTLDCHAITDDYVIFDEALAANIAILTNLRPRQDHNKLPNLGAIADVN